MADENDELGDEDTPDEDLDEEEFDAKDLDEEDLDEEDLDEEDLVAVDLDADLVGDDVPDDALVEIPVADLDDDVDVDVEVVEEDLDTILRDRIAAGTDAEEEEEEVATEERTETGDRVSPRKPEEVSCPECFLLVRRSQFSTRRADCPGGLDGADCPMMKVFVPAG